jgi:hypothetical protein
MTKKISEKLIEISKVIAGMSGGISYIRNEGDFYTIGTKDYSDKIAEYLNQNFKTWNGSEADIKRKKGKGEQNKNSKVGYLWKIPLNENNIIV